MSPMEDQQALRATLRDMIVVERGGKFVSWLALGAAVVLLVLLHFITRDLVTSSTLKLHIDPLREDIGEIKLGLADLRKEIRSMKE